MSKKATDSLVFGTVLLLLGTAFLLDNFGFDIELSAIFARYWPVILIAFGAMKVKRALQQRMDGNEGA